MSDSEIAEAINLYKDDEDDEFEKLYSTLTFDEQNTVDLNIDKYEERELWNRLTQAQMYDEVVYRLNYCAPVANYRIVKLLKQMGRPEEEKQEKKEIKETLSRLSAYLMVQESGLSALLVSTQYFEPCIEPKKNTTRERIKTYLICMKPVNNWEHTLKAKFENRVLKDGKCIIEIDEKKLNNVYKDDIWRQLKVYKKCRK